VPQGHIRRLLAVLELVRCFFQHRKGDADLWMALQQGFWMMCSHQNHASGEALTAAP